MAIGSAIALFVLGAILYFAVEVQVAGVDINVIGQILMIGGAVGGVIGLFLLTSRRRTQTTREVHPTADGGAVQHVDQRF